jgi:ribosome-binding factor A
MARGTRSGRTASQRQLRVGEELRHALAQVFMRQEIIDPDLRDVTITVTEVRVSPDLRNATAFVTPLGGRDAERVVPALNRCAGWLRGQVTRMVRLKFSPQVKFELDRSFDAADKVDALLRREDVARDLGHGDGAEDSGDTSSGLD